MTMQNGEFVRLGHQLLLSGLKTGQQMENQTWPYLEHLDVLPGEEMCLGNRYACASCDIKTNGILIFCELIFHFISFF